MRNEKNAINQISIIKISVSYFIHICVIENINNKNKNSLKLFN